MQQLLAEHVTFKKSMTEAEQEFLGIVAIDTEAKKIAQDNNIAVIERNPYSSLTIKV